MARIPLPLDDADPGRRVLMGAVHAAGGTSGTLVFDHDGHAGAFFEALLCENMDLGRPET